MGEALGDKEHVLLLGREIHPYILSISWAVLPQVDGHIVHFTLGHPYQLCLRKLLLEMQAPEYALAGLALVVLHELTGNAGLVEVGLVVRLHEVASLIAEYFRLDDEHAFYLSLGECELSHLYPSSLSVCIHLLVVVLVGAAGHALHPLLVL